jgi:hypothetical protein
LGETLLPIAAALEAQTAVIGTYGIEDQRLVIQIKACDVRTGKVVATALAYSLEGLAGYNFVESITDSLSSQLKRYLSLYDPGEAITYEIVEDILFRSSLEGMAVSYGTGFPSGLITGGELRLPYFPFIVGSSIKVKKSREGYYPATEELVLSKTVNEIQLRPLDKKYTNEVSLYYLFQEVHIDQKDSLKGWGAGIGYRYYPIPDYVFAGPDIRIYQRPKIYGDDQNSTHFDISAGGGLYLFSRYKSYIRCGLSCGLGAVISFDGTNDRYFDLYINAATFFLDINIRPWTIFAQTNLRFGIGPESTGLFSQWEFLDRFPLVVGVRRKW